MTLIHPKRNAPAALTIAAGLLACSAGGCIAHDTGIQVTIGGFDWCGQAVGAVAYDDVPGDGEPILVPNFETPPSDDYPMDCTCFTPGSDEQMQAWRDGTPPVPADPEYPAYADALKSIQDAVYERCTVAHLAEYPGYNTTTCPETSYSATMPIWRRSGEGLDTDCTVTVGEGEAGTTGSMLEPSMEIVCTSQGHCGISSSYIEEVTHNLSLAASDSAFGKFVTGSSGSGLKLLRVASTDITYRLGLRTNDVLLSVNGLLLHTQAHVETAMLSLWSTSSFSVSIRRGTATLTYVYTIT